MLQQDKSYHFFHMDTVTLLSGLKKKTKKKPPDPKLYLLIMQD